ncbi:MAG: thioredoxin family protein [Phycisphaerae bacterium]|nr:thioredoxin family protein [Phycisphaerae bacterium]
MARTPSTMQNLGTPMPGFRLADHDANWCSSEDFKNTPVLVMFICNHCPFVVHVLDQLASLGRDYGGSIGMVAINSNDITTHPDDRPEKMAELAADNGFAFPYVFDETQEVARSFDAACTPDFFLYDRDHRLVYRGQLDDSRPDSGIPVTGKDLRAAIEALVAGEAVPQDQKPSLGCNIKWKQPAAAGE